MKHRVDGVLPALVAQATPIRSILDESIAIRIAVSIDPLKRLRNRPPE
jgi:hypothetical protein